MLLHDSEPRDSPVLANWFRLDLKRDLGLRSGISDLWFDHIAIRGLSRSLMNFQQWPRHAW